MDEDGSSWWYIAGRMLDMGSGGPTRYFVHAVLWNSRRRVAARSAVVAVSDISGLASSDHRSGVLEVEITDRSAKWPSTTGYAGNLWATTGNLITVKVDPGNLRSSNIGLRPTDAGDRVKSRQ